MTSSQISKRYTKAVFDLANDQNNVNEVLGDLNAVADIIQQDKKLNQFLLSPVSNKTDSISIISLLNEKLALQDLTFKFLNILSENKRLDLIADVRKEFLDLSNQKNKIVTVDVLSVHQLESDVLARVKDSIKTCVKSDIKINNVVDSSIIGGLVVKIGSKVIDASLKNSVKRISQKMKEAI